MGTEQLEQQTQVEVDIENVGGIDRAAVTFSPGVTILAGRNATNRTSFLRALMAALGSDDASVKGGTDEGRVELAVGDETYTRRLVRRGDGVAMDGDPYLEDSTLADLFAFLLESNDARRAVTRGDDLRDLIMRPVDTEDIEAEIDRLVDRREEIERELDRIDERKRELPDLERERDELEEDIEETREELAAVEAELESLEGDIEEKQEAKSAVEQKLAELQETRSTLEDVRYDLETEEQSLKELRAEKRDLEAERSELPEAPAGEREDLDERIDRLRSRKRNLETEVDELQRVTQFNEGMLDGEETEVLVALENGSGSDGNGAVTDRLLDDETVSCWTCGSDVEAEQIETTVGRLRELTQDKLNDVRDIEAELDDLEERRREVKRHQRRREDIERELRRVKDDITKSEEAIERLRGRRDDLTDEVERLEREIEDLEDETHGEMLDLHRRANELEHELGQLETERDRVTDAIADIEDRLDEREDLEARREQLREELEGLRTKIDRIEQDAVEGFNEHMDTVLELLGYDDVERIWLERAEREVRRGRQTVTERVFELHVVRTTESGATYEDTIDHLSESEREVTGLIFALAGYLAHDVYEEVPFILLDSIEAIDADRIATLVDYFSEYSDYLVVALLPEDAAALDEEYERIEDVCL